MKSVSVIVPCYNERQTIGLLLSALSEQDYPLDLVEVIIADGGSTDGTQQTIAAFGQAHPQLNIKLVDNPRRIIPAALNTAIRHASNDIILRLDAHCVPQPNYISRSLESLMKRDAANVGGVWDIKPGAQTWMAASIAYAASHPLGVGDAKYRFTRDEGYVDTVPFGAFPRSLVDEIGYFNEELLSNEDYEFNARIRQTGKKIWLDPAVRSTYFSRADLDKLARQYWRYGYWKWRMIQRFPGTLRWRQALPPLFVVTVLVLLILMPFVPALRVILPLLLLVYVLTLVIAALPVALHEKDLRLLVGIPIAIMTMHFNWGTAFLWSMVSSQVGHFQKNG